MPPTIRWIGWSAAYSAIIKNVSPSRRSPPQRGYPACKTARRPNECCPCRYINAFTVHFEEAIEVPHSSGPLRSIVVPEGQSEIDRPTGRTMTSASSVHVGGLSRCASGSVDRTRSLDKTVTGLCRRNLSRCRCSAWLTVPKAEFAESFMGACPELMAI